MSSDSQSSPFPRFTLRQMFFATAVLGVIAAVYGEYGVDGLLGSMIVWPLAFVLYGIFWRNGRLCSIGSVAQILCCLIASLMPRYAITSVSRGTCQDQLKQIGIALDEANLQAQPQRTLNDSSGRPVLSWRVSLLPFLEQTSLYSKFRLYEPWDSSHNLPLSENQIKLYHCPVDRGRNSRPSDTSYLVVAGENTMWKHVRKLPYAEIPDGASQTILLVESHSTGIVWSEPRDFTTEEFETRINGPQGKGLSSRHGPTASYFDGSRRLRRTTGANVLMADGSVRFLSNDTDPEVLRSMIDRRDGKP